VTVELDHPSWQPSAVYTVNWTVFLARKRPVAQKETVPVERVQLDTDTVTEQQTVGEDVRKERVDVEGDVPRSERP
jgi:Domain of unknown function (DUF2382)